MLFISGSGITLFEVVLIKPAMVLAAFGAGLLGPPLTSLEEFSCCKDTSRGEGGEDLCIIRGHYR